MFPRFVANLLAVVLIPLVSTAFISLVVPSSALIPNPNTLPPSTSATLTDLGRVHTAALQRDNRFTFRNVSAGSYLLDVHCRDYVFAPFRVDVSSSDKVEAWQTFRGHEWDNKGEKIMGSPVELKVLGGKDYYDQRSGCKSCIELPCMLRETWKLMIGIGIVSPLSLLKSPMILLAVVGLGLVVGMPYLIDNSTTINLSTDVPTVC